MSSPSSLTAAEVEALILTRPYHRWLGLKVLSLADDAIEMRATWREEWIVNPERRTTHGGVLAALVDIGGDFALVRRIGRGVPTIDLHVDYHRPAFPGDLIVRGRVIKFGRQFSVCEAQVFDADDKLLASGRGAYVTATGNG